MHEENAIHLVSGVECWVKQVIVQEYAITVHEYMTQEKVMTAPMHLSGVREMDGQLEAKD